MKKRFEVRLQRGSGIVFDRAPLVPENRFRPPAEREAAIAYHARRVAAELAAIQARQTNRGRR